MGDQPRDGAVGGGQAGGRGQGAIRCADVATCKTNLFRWLSQAVDELNKDPAGIVYCWEETKLLRAWEGAVQAEAAGKANELFPNSSRDDYLCRPTSRRTQRPASWDFHSLSPSRSTSAKAGSTGTSLKSSSQRSTNHVYSSGLKSVLYICHLTLLKSKFFEIPYILPHKLPRLEEEEEEKKRRRRRRDKKRKKR